MDSIASARATKFVALIEIPTAQHEFLAALSKADAQNVGVAVSLLLTAAIERLQSAEVDPAKGTKHAIEQEERERLELLARITRATGSAERAVEELTALVKARAAK